MDEKDLELLRILEENSRLSAEEIAIMTSLATAEVTSRVPRFRQVKSLRLITGTYDLQLIVSGKNMQEVSRFVSEHVAPMDRIRETATHIIMKSYKENGNAFFELPETERLPISP
jgi:DNA-binding Lrp family transcriptional regulator